MKKEIFFVIFVLTCKANAGLFVEKGLYIESDLAIGYGETREVAEKDARASIPKNFKIAKNINSPAIQCTDSNQNWNAKDECIKGKVRYVLPIVKN
jgi:hypothetical protein